MKNIDYDEQNSKNFDIFDDRVITKKNNNIIKNTETEDTQKIDTDILRKELNDALKYDFEDTKNNADVSENKKKETIFKVIKAVIVFIAVITMVISGYFFVYANTEKGKISNNAKYLSKYIEQTYCLESHPEFIETIKEKYDGNKTGYVYNANIELDNDILFSPKVVVWNIQHPNSKEIDLNKFISFETELETCKKKVDLKSEISKYIDKINHNIRAEYNENPYVINVYTDYSVAKEIKHNYKDLIFFGDILNQYTEEHSILSINMIYTDVSFQLYRNTIINKDVPIDVKDKFELCEEIITFLKLSFRNEAKFEALKYDNLNIEVILHQTLIKGRGDTDYVFARLINKFKQISGNHADKSIQLKFDNCEVNYAAGFASCELFDIDEFVKSVFGVLDNNLYYLVSIDYKDNINIEKRIILEGDKITDLHSCTRYGYDLYNWFYSDTNSVFDPLTHTIKKDCEIYAKWISKTDDKTDSDNDGLPDYIEWFTLKKIYDPFNEDTNNDGVLDGDEDLDGDGLINRKEIQYKTHPNMKDTDKDGISDYDEIIVHHTDPLRNKITDYFYYWYKGILVEVQPTTETTETKPSTTNPTTTTTVPTTTTTTTTETTTTELTEITTTERETTEPETTVEETTEENTTNTPSSSLPETAFSENSENNTDIDFSEEMSSFVEELTNMISESLTDKLN